MAPWATYSRLLERVAEQELRELLGAKEHDRYLFVCGALYAIKRIAQAPAFVATYLEELRSRDRTRRSADADARARAGLIFTNTPWYDAWQSDADAPGPVARGT